MKYVLITGAYGGMGRAVSLCLRDAGYTVFALDRCVGEAEEGIIPLPADLRREEDIQEAVRRIRTETEQLYAVLHFAGLYLLDSFLEISEEALTRAFDVNLLGVIRVNRACLPLLGKGSRILITTSELAPLKPLPFTGIYAVTKHALDAYAYSLRMEAQLLGISVIVLRPGAVKTDMIGASQKALTRFCQESTLYACNADRFRRIVEGVEAREIPPERVARRVARLLRKRRPPFVSSINRNPLLLLLELLPPRMATAIIRRILR